MYFSFLEALIVTVCSYHLCTTVFSLALNNSQYFDKMDRFLLQRNMNRWFPKVTTAPVRVKWAKPEAPYFDKESLGFHPLLSFIPLLKEKSA